MKKDLLLSIHSQYAEKIIRGQKKIELRRRFPLFKQQDSKKIFIYACSPISMIIGECSLKEVKKFPLKKLWKISKNTAMIDRVEFYKYFIDCEFGFALYLENPIKYKNPIYLKKLLGSRSQPPQSYRYVIDKLIA